MKKILLLNFAAILSCFAIGIICALGYIYSGWWLSLHLFTMLLGWIPFAELYEKMDEYLGGITTVIVTDFLLSVITLIICIPLINEETFIGITILSTSFFMTIASMVLLYKLRWK